MKTQMKIMKKKKEGNEKINLRKLNPQKYYYECSSLLEFLIISLCKNFELDMRQSVALLSNNRKYLQFICNKGVKNEITKVKNWLEDLNKNYNLSFSPFSFFFSIKVLFNYSIFFLKLQIH